ncbi:hypothetical protein [Helicobacter fennelliae]|uniref:hypothetical protein n=1 Tax=Helicobacter fennelliae TaxID=215 RepID=UPI001F35355B|nr:hypothetical protein [Helicobacter fennelliae]
MRSDSIKRFCIATKDDDFTFGFERVIKALQSDCKLFEAFALNASATDSTKADEFFILKVERLEYEEFG